MKKLKIKFENCYGINQIETVFDFTQQRTYAIYSPNGTMKTSFANTFKDFSNDIETKDLIYDNKITMRNILDENDTPLIKENVFVVESYDPKYESEKISTLLVNKTLKTQYDEIVKDIDLKKEALLKELKKCSKLANNTEETLSFDIARDNKSFLKALSRLKGEIREEEKNGLEDIVYKSIFNDKVMTLLNNAEFKSKLSEYIEVYDSLISKSNFFKKGIFNHYNASDMTQNLENNGFFKAEHSVYINIGSEKIEIKTQEELKKAIETEKQGIIESQELLNAFEDLDKLMNNNADLRNFRDYIEKNKEILIELENLEKFKDRLWVAYLSKNFILYKTLMDTYENALSEIQKIYDAAKAEITIWQEVIDIFNQRFSVPFIVKVTNRDDTILGKEQPSIEFEFNQRKGENNVSIDKKSLIGVLSNGEKRALYILNIIFEVEARKHAKQETLFIIDDIADSFDYKNKYAIIEYLKEISQNDFFYQIILSHNFDFYRTVSNRLGLERENRLHSLTFNDKILINQEKYQKNPFLYWKKHLDNNQMLIASIPFIRNLAEYCNHKSEFEQLTSLLHIKSDTGTLTIKHLEDIIRVVISSSTDFKLNNPSDLIIDLIDKTANEILLETEEVLDLEKKVILSIAIRLKAENYMISKINNPVFVNAITKNQTFELVEKYASMTVATPSSLSILKKVNLMTPENIHLNSFMYEPILDMSNEHLKGLYKAVCNLI